MELVELVTLTFILVIVYLNPVLQNVADQSVTIYPLCDILCMLYAADFNANQCEMDQFQSVLNRIKDKGPKVHQNMDSISNYAKCASLCVILYCN